MTPATCFDPLPCTHLGPSYTTEFTQPPSIHLSSLPLMSVEFSPPRPHLERVVVGAGDDLVVVELEARDDVLVVALQHARRTHRPRPPVQLHVVVPHEVRLKWVRWLGINITSSVFIFVSSDIVSSKLGTNMGFKLGTNMALA